MAAKFILLFIVVVVAQYAKADNVRYGDLGSFTDEEPWGGTDERPGHQLPSDPTEVNTRFYLDTRRQTEMEVDNRNMAELTATTFDPAKVTRFIVHGYVQNGDTNWMNEMSQAFLVKEDVNVIRVGWFGGSLQINYAKSASDTQIVGAEIALMVKNIRTELQGNTAAQGMFHCIGHSLGAHACSYTGDWLEARANSRLSRVTGLDPAGPYFQNTPELVRLDATDADFVDVIHSDSEKLANLGMGINQVSGAIDFWPNDGVEQPGCDQNSLTTILDPDGIVNGAQNFVACNHLRSVEFFIESITSTCPFYGYPCTSFADYLAGKCQQCTSAAGCVSMGFNAILGANSVSQESTPNHYLATRAEKPYCQYMTYVQVTLGAGSDEIGGKLYLTLYGPTENTEQAQLSDEDVSLDLRPSRTYAYAAHFATYPSNFNRVKLLWYQDEWSISKQRLTVDQIQVFVAHRQQKFTFCGDSSEQLEPERRYEFLLC